MSDSKDRIKRLFEEFLYEQREREITFCLGKSIRCRDFNAGDVHLRLEVFRSKNYGDVVLFTLWLRGEIALMAD